jgi:hypothetical protein
MSTGEPIMQLLIEYRRVKKALWAELQRHTHEHGCDSPGCELRRALLHVWGTTQTMATALDFVALGELPHGYCIGYDTEGWLAEYIPGPWRDPSLPLEATP